MRRLILFVLITLICWFAEDSARAAADLRLPQDAVAGQPMTVGTSGSGSGTLYLVGPGQVIKHEVKLGSDTQIKGEELHSAGRWIAILRSGGGQQSAVFWVKSGQPANLSFLAKPSRVPVAQRNGISGTVFVFDKFNNLISQPTPVNFNLSVNRSGPSQTVTSQGGVAFIDASSGPKEGAAQFVASAGGVSVRRVVQQVASDACSGSLRIHVAQRDKDNIVVETDPVRDCSGNPVPDGTIVTFIETDKQGKSTVDARIRKGIAKAELPASSNATIAVAAGVTLGNELHVGGGE